MRSCPGPNHWLNGSVRMNFRRPSVLIACLRSGYVAKPEPRLLLRLEYVVESTEHFLKLGGEVVEVSVVLELDVRAVLDNETDHGLSRSRNGQMDFGVTCCGA